MGLQSMLYRAPFGIAGELSRNAAQSSVEPQAMGATALAAYGIAVKMVAGLIVPLAASTDIVYGFLVRPVPTTDAGASEAIGTAVPPAPGTGGIQQLNILRRGYLSVYVAEGAGSVAAGSAVWVRYVTNGALVQGGIGGATVASNNYSIGLTNAANLCFGTGAWFTGPADANGFAEIAFNL